MKPEGSSDRKYQNNDDDYRECIKKNTGCNNGYCCDGRGHYLEKGRKENCGCCTFSEIDMWRIQNKIVVRNINNT